MASGITGGLDVFHALREEALADGKARELFALDDEDLATLLPDALATFAAQAVGLEGVRWVDRTADISRLLTHYRHMMSWLLLAGVAVVFVVLAVRYRGQAWRVITPTVLAGVLTVALLGWLGQPLQLFNVLALMLLLGMGIDYGIFLVEHRGDASAWLAVCVGAASTWLSFGLLGLSATPALRAFGLTLLFGIGLVWLLSPLFRGRERFSGGDTAPAGSRDCQGHSSSSSPASAFSNTCRRPRRRTIAWPWIWQTRDSLTPSTAPISFRLSSCS